jgi:hypothetical protein
VIGTGSNDLLYVSRQSADWVAAHPTYLNDLIVTLSAEVATLQVASARTILVTNPTPARCTPVPVVSSPTHSPACTRSRSRSGRRSGRA